MALAAIANYVCNFLVESHMHLHSILHGMYNGYGLMIDGCRMGIGAVTVEDDTCKLRAPSPCLSWKIICHDLSKG